VRLIGDFSDSVSVISAPILRMGSARRNIEKNKFLNLISNINFCTNMCMVINPIGEVFSCGCALGTEMNHGLYLGNLEEKNLHYYHNAWLEDTILLYLQCEGIDALESLAIKIGVISQPFGSSISFCEKCITLLGNTELVSYVRQEYSDESSLRRFAVRRFLLHGDSFLLKKTST
jgi:hypothetical protein